MNFPRKVRVIESGNEWCHGHTIGDIVTAEAPYDRRSGAISAVDNLGCEQLLTKEDYEELTGEVTLTPAKVEQQSTTSRIKYLYSVQDTDGVIICNTRDREYARDAKASMGGKKEGIIIMAYAPTKEIR